MKAMILAAGRGERMQPLTLTTPKPLLKVAGKPLLEYRLEQLARAGVTDLVINHSHLGQQLEDYFKTGEDFGVRIQWSRETHPLETAGGIIKALPLLGSAPFLLFNGDVWCDLNIESLLQGPHIDALLEAQNLAHLVLVDNPLHNKKGDFGLVDGKVTPCASNLLTYAGIAVINPALFHSSPDNASEAETQAKLGPLLRAASEKNQVSGIKYSGDWQDIGTPQRLQQLEQQLTGHSG